ncbi:thiolase family protein [Candidatus Marinamargulisbacteria bacterium]|nr:thiolase family protein [Candidatus Marinamargulisbacteria bacterium]
MSKKDRLAIINGLRTGFGKAGGQFKSLQADDLGAVLLREVLAQSPVDATQITDVFLGNVAQPGHAANIARVIALKAGLDQSIPAATVHRNCASGMESISTAYQAIASKQSDICVVGGVESMSNIPLLFNASMTQFFETLSRLKSTKDKLRHCLSFRPRFMTPIIGVVQGLTDPVSNLIMGLTAENLAQEFCITRAEQDAYAVLSHQKAATAESKHRFDCERHAIPNPGYTHMIHNDECIRNDQSLDALGKLRPYFDRKLGTVTVGNACPINDGAVAMIVMAESKAAEMGLSPIGYIHDYAYAGLEPERMGLGPVYATQALLKKTGFTLTDFDIIEINEAFAAQVIACERAFEQYGIGKIDPKKLNVNGGAIALGHPVGATGARLILTALHELRTQQKERALATLCIGGGQGGAFIVEAAA